MRPIDLSKLRPFYMVAREGSMNKAAAKLNVSQPSLSLLIGDLEHNLKTQLFERLPTGVRLTAQGEHLYAFAENILQQTDSFEKKFHEKEDEINGDIKIVTTPFVGSEWLVPNLTNFLKKYPKINVRILLRSENINLAEGDIAILTYIPQQPHLIQQHLFTVQVRLFASPLYLKKYGRPNNIEDLDNHNLITYKGDHYSPYGSTNWLLNLSNTDKILPKKSYFEINSLHGMLRSAIQGIGIVELPNYSVILNSDLIEVLPEIEGPETPIYFTYPKIRKSSKKINLLLEYLSKKGK
ncbi:MAG: LysR family transcriptional regulator [Candidatus Paracaedibacteraceae bacterium]|nr:LysR family transcriptional regulator [Candidatus Paracaedibacteraceae bacterium]